jgi:hypothetical protein
VYGWQKVLSEISSTFCTGRQNSLASVRRTESVDANSEVNASVLTHGLAGLLGGGWCNKSGESKRSARFPIQLQYVIH